jgi:hypothetical protein
VAVGAKVAVVAHRCCCLTVTTSASCSTTCTCVIATTTVTHSYIVFIVVPRTIPAALAAALHSVAVFFLDVIAATAAQTALAVINLVFFVWAVAIIGRVDWVVASNRR